MAYHMNREDGEGIEGAADVGREMGSNVESVERLARILYNHYDRKGDSQNAVIFNNLVTGMAKNQGEDVRRRTTQHSHLVPRRVGNCVKKPSFSRKLGFSGQSYQYVYILYISYIICIIISKNYTR